MIETITLRILLGALFVLFAGGVLCVFLGSRGAVNRLGGLLAVAGCLAAGGAGAWALR